MWHRKPEQQLKINQMSRGYVSYKSIYRTVEPKYAPIDRKSKHPKCFHRNCSAPYESILDGNAVCNDSSVHFRSRLRSAGLKNPYIFKVFPFPPSIQMMLNTFFRVWTKLKRPGGWTDFRSINYWKEKNRTHMTHTHIDSIVSELDRNVNVAHGIPSMLTD